DAVDRVRKAEESADGVLQRAGSVETEIDRLLGDLRAAANGLVENLNGAARSLTAELESVRSEFAAVREARLEPVPPGGVPASEVEETAPEPEPELLAEVESAEVEAAQEEPSF